MGVDIRASAVQLYDSCTPRARAFPPTWWRRVAVQQEMASRMGNCNWRSSAVKRKAASSGDQAYQLAKPAEIHDQAYQLAKPAEIHVCQSGSCRRQGAKSTLQDIEELVSAAGGLNCTVRRTGCVGG